MTYHIITKKKFLGITFTKKYKNITYHGWPTNFNNQSIFMMVDSLGSYHFIDVKNLEELIIPGEAIAVMNMQNQNQNQEPEKQEPTEGQKEILKQNGLL